MSSAQNTATVVDFQAFKERRVRAEQPREDSQTTAAAPVFAWFPVWIMVPQFPQF